MICPKQVSQENGRIKALDTSTAQEKSHGEKKQEAGAIWTES